MKNIIAFLVLVFCTLNLSAQKIPKVYSNISYSTAGDLVVDINGEKYTEIKETTYLTLSNMIGNPRGTSLGIFFDFKAPNLNGHLHFGLIPDNKSKHPQPVFFNTPAVIAGGMGIVVIQNQLEGKYDVAHWRKNGRGTLGYRFIEKDGSIIYDGKVNFIYDGESFKVDNTIIEGPFVNNVTDSSAVIWFKTNMDCKCMVKIDDKLFETERKSTHHEFLIANLEPATEYEYTVLYAENEKTYQFNTAPKPGTRTKFTFGYASDSRSGAGGGERNIYGTNSYIVKRLFAMAYNRDVAFVQFSGDMINGYVTIPEQADLQYSNWKRTIENYAHYFPVYTTMGNHEAVMREFRDSTGDKRVSVNRFPFDKESGEVVFQRNFVNPLNGPESEDGAVYDPRPRREDFPSYKESVYYFVYDNVAMVVLNSNYLFSPAMKYVDGVEGNLHGYIMDNQLKWFADTMEKLEADPNIDHIFVTIHTPFFPNGGHVSDDMFYNGDNSYRAVINGKKVEKGIIERRDQLLNIAINKSKKTLALLTGDEHNYCRMMVTPQTTIYPENYSQEKIKIKRNFYQINNGSAGAPYYGQEKAPWSEWVQKFSTQYALVLFEVDGKKVKIKVVNPDTFEMIDRYELTKSK